MTDRFLPTSNWTGRTHVVSQRIYWLMREKSCLEVPYGLPSVALSLDVFKVNTKKLSFF